MSKKKSTSLVPQSFAIPNRPMCPEDLREIILIYGGFCEGLEYLTKVLESETSSTLIIRGDVGVGKRSLVEKALSLRCNSSLRKPTAIYLNPYMLTDDYSAMRYLASQLGIKNQGSIQDMVEAIEAQSKKRKEKLVIVLLQFEEFCRQKQSLLYNLTNLSQHGHNITLIGLTISLDCTKNLEKRVRSRLMSSFHHLKPPYRNMQEYLEFSSYLLGKEKITGRLEERLKYMYLTGNRSIRQLKRFLLTLCSWDDDGQLTVDHPVGTSIDPSSDVHTLPERLEWLTRPQRELLKMAVYYTYDSQSSDFNLQILEETARKHHYSSFETTSPLAYKNTAILVKLGLFKPCKPNQMITQHALFSVGVFSTQFKHALEKNAALHSFKTDPLWKKLR